MADDLLSALTLLAGAGNVRTDEETRERASSSWSPLHAKRRQAGAAPTPAAVVLPGSAEDVAAVVRWANATRTPLFPVGGGSSTVGNVSPMMPRGVALDLSRMDAIDWDEESLLVTAGAGCGLGRLEETLNRHDYTLGHFPRSLNLATVGGAVATNAVGLLSGKYGRQADITAAIEAVLPTGDIVRTSPAPGANACFDLHGLLVGTEGQFGVVTAATLRMRPVPEARAWAVFSFKSLGDAIDAARLVYRSDARPAVLRVFDAAAAVDEIRGVPSGAAALLLMGFEGEELVQTGQYQVAHAVCQHVGGMEQSPDLGDAWFDARYQTGWFAPNARPGGLADVFAVSATWSVLKEVEGAMRRAVAPFVTRLAAQLAHATPNGAALEVAWQAQAEPATPEAAVALYERVAGAAFTACLDAGGSVAHHYGVGPVRWSYVVRGRGGASLRTLRTLKAGLDPNNILNPGVSL
jgi:alkyldihydroxyacetonephosphate synthase